MYPGTQGSGGGIGITDEFGNKAAVPHQKTHTQPSIPSFMTADLGMGAQYQNPIDHFNKQFNSRNPNNANGVIMGSYNPNTANNINNSNNNGIDTNGNSNLLSSPKGHSKKKSLTNSFFDGFDASDDPDPNDLKEEEEDENRNSNNNKSRQEVEIRWTCPLCTYHNNMFMQQCELCGTIKPENAVTVQKTVEDTPSFKDVPSSSTGDDEDHLFGAISGDDSGPGPAMSPDKIAQYYQQNHNNNFLSPSNSIASPQYNKPKHQARSASDTFVFKKTWICAVCTFAENPMDHPVCKICGALPPTRPPTPEPDPVPAPSSNNNNNNNIGPLGNLDLGPQAITQSHEIKTKQMFAEQEEYLRKLSKSHENDNNGNKQKRDSVDMNEIPNIPNDLLGDENDTDPLHATHRGSISNIPVKNASRTQSRKESKEDDESAGHHPNPPKERAPRSPQQEALDPNQNEAKKQWTLGRAIVSVKQKLSGNGHNKRSRTRSDVSDRDPSKHSTRKHSQGRSKSRERTKGGPVMEKSSTEESEKVNSSQKNISVADIPAKQRDKIRSRLNALTTKSALDKELQSSMTKLKQKLENHATNVMKHQAHIKKISTEKLRDLKQWREYYIVEMQQHCLEFYDNKLLYLQTCIEIERLHTECYSVKLQKLESAQKNIKKNSKKYTIDEVRNAIDGAFNTAWRIRLSDDVKDKQDFKKELNSLVGASERTYKIKKETYPTEISFEERKEKVVLFLRSALNQYESLQMSENQSYELQTDLNNEEHFFYPYQRNEQIQFDSFILDQRTKEGRIVNKWLQFLIKNEKKATIDDIRDFQNKLTHTFLHTYELTVNKYYQCVRIFVYRCILRRRIVRKIVENILLYKSNELKSRDSLFRKKTFWMRTVKYDGLGINQAYWMDPNLMSIAALTINYNNDNSNNNNKTREHSKSANNNNNNKNDDSIHKKHQRMATNESDLLKLDVSVSNGGIGSGAPPTPNTLNMQQSTGSELRRYDSDEDELLNKGNGSAGDIINNGDFGINVIDDFTSTAAGSFRRRPSQIGYMAGSGVPYADAINLIGQLEADNSPTALKSKVAIEEQKKLEKKTSTK